MKRKKGNNESINFWQSSSDLMTALALILMLIILLLILYLIHRPTEYDNFEAHDSTGQYDESNWDNESEEEEDDHHYDYEHDTDNNGGGGGGGGDDSGDQPGNDIGEYPEEGEGIKSAVFVEMVDAETDRVVKEEGVQFELYGEKGILEILHTYYPEKTAYRIFETTKDGVFYLPEKIWENRSYYLHQLTEPSGYDIADNVEFQLDQMYDWADPYVVRVPLYPSRNTIRIQMVDQATEQSIPGGSFNVVAAEDITTTDGTLRFRKGEVVDTIQVDETGRGESGELFLGSYQLKQNDIPEYYASVAGNITKAVEKKTGGKEEILTIGNERTVLKLHLTDELTGDPIPNAEFIVSHDGEQETARTDASGMIEINTIDKDTTYTFTQTSTSDGYIMDDDGIEVEVSKTGRFVTEAERTLEATNRMLRVQVGVVDAVLGRQVRDTKIAIYDAEDNEVKSWTANNSSVVLTDLEEGHYYMVVNGKTGAKYPFDVANKAEIQNVEVEVWTFRSIIAIVIIAMVTAGIGYAAFRLLRYLRKKKKKAESEQEFGREKTESNKEE